MHTYPRVICLLSGNICTIFRLLKTKMGSVLIGIDTNSPQELGLQYPGHVPCKLIFSAKDGTHMKAIILGFVHTAVSSG